MIPKAQFLVGKLAVIATHFQISNAHKQQIQQYLYTLDINSISFSKLRDLISQIVSFHNTKLYELHIEYLSNLLSETTPLLNKLVFPLNFNNIQQFITCYQHLITQIPNFNEPKYIDIYAIQKSDLLVVAATLKYSVIQPFLRSQLQLLYQKFNTIIANQGSFNYEDDSKSQLSISQLHSIQNSTLGQQRTSFIVTSPLIEHESQSLENKDVIKNMILKLRINGKYLAMNINDLLTKKKQHVKIISRALETSNQTPASQIIYRKQQLKQYQIALLQNNQELKLQQFQLEHKMAFVVKRLENLLPRQKPNFAFMRNRLSSLRQHEIQLRSQRVQLQQYNYCSDSKVLKRSSFVDYLIENLNVAEETSAKLENQFVLLRHQLRQFTEPAQLLGRQQLELLKQKQQLQIRIIHVLQNTRLKQFYIYQTSNVGTQQQYAFINTLKSKFRMLREAWQSSVYQVQYKTDQLNVLANTHEIYHYQVAELQDQLLNTICSIGPEYLVTHITQEVSKLKQHLQLLLADFNDLQQSKQQHLEISQVFQLQSLELTVHSNLIQKKQEIEHSNKQLQIKFSMLLELRNKLKFDQHRLSTNTYYQYRSAQVKLQSLQEAHQQLIQHQILMIETQTYCHFTVSYEQLLSDREINQQHYEQLSERMQYLIEAQVRSTRYCQLLQQQQISLLSLHDHFSAQLSNFKYQKYLQFLCDFFSCDLEQLLQMHLTTQHEIVQFVENDVNLHNSCSKTTIPLRDKILCLLFGKIDVSSVFMRQYVQRFGAIKFTESFHQELLQEYRKMKVYTPSVLSVLEGRSVIFLDQEDKEEGEQYFEYEVECGID